MSEQGVNLGREVVVEITTMNPIFVRYVSCLMDEFYVAVSGQQHLLRFDVKDLFRYCATILYCRVAWVRRERPFLKANDRFLTPDFIYLLSQSIGIASDPDSGLELTPIFNHVVENDVVMFPGFDETLVPAMTYDEVITMSRYLSLFKNHGFVFAVGYWKKVEGRLDVMATWCVQENAVSHRPKSHPVVALMSSTLNLQAARNLLNPVINYGPLKQFESLMEMLAIPRGGARK